MKTDVIKTVRNDRCYILEKQVCFSSYESKNYDTYVASVYNTVYNRNSVNIESVLIN